MLLQKSEILENKNLSLLGFIFISLLVHLAFFAFFSFNIFYKEKNLLSNSTSINVVMVSNKNLVDKKQNPKDTKINKKELHKKENPTSSISENKALTENIVEEKQTVKNENNEDFVLDESGEYIAKSQYVANIEYKILSSVEPKYPKIAIRVNYNKDVIVKTRLLVNKEGKVEKIEFMNSDANNPIFKDFQGEVLKSLYKWQFTPIKINDQIMKVYFYKDFKFISQQLSVAEVTTYN